MNYTVEYYTGYDVCSNNEAANPRKDDAMIHFYHVLYTDHLEGKQMKIAFPMELYSDEQLERLCWTVGDELFPHGYDWDSMTEEEFEHSDAQTVKLLDIITQVPMKMEEEEG